MKYYGQFNLPVDEFIYRRYFKNNTTDSNQMVCLECGAFDGLTECSCKFFEESLGWKSINVEPSPIIYKKLVKNRPNSINVNVALSDSNGESKFYSVDHPVYGELCTNGSLHHTEQHKKALLNEGCKFVEYTVEVITYPELIKRFSIERLDLFVLDVEGHEFSVLNSMKNAKVLPKIFVVEHGQLNREKIIETVKELGYIYDTSLYVNSFFIRSDATDVLQSIKTSELSEYLKTAKDTEQKMLEGVIVSPSNQIEMNNKMFVMLDIECLDEKFVKLKSISGIEDKDCSDQEVIYILKDKLAGALYIRAIKDDDRNFAAWRGSDYLNAGAHAIFDRSLLGEMEYTVSVVVKDKNHYYSNGFEMKLSL